ncbi:MAG: T9SS type A sorting domain-containing protein, partial [Ekhidna sp.]|nr:T9SS type A sorting domain-containing protein [Ekhidna sp.]
SVQPVVTIAAGTSPVTEGTEAAFTLTAAPAPMANLTVSLSVAEAAGSDFVASGDEGTKTVVIPTSGSATYTVATVNDNADEPDGSVTVIVVDGTGYMVGTPSEASVTVNDNDEAPLGTAENAVEIVVFPNPSGRYLEVRSPVGGTFKILSLNGKSLLEGTTNTRTDITSLQSGLYLVQLPDGRLLKFVRE